jgi:hypothetical protein
MLPAVGSALSCMITLSTLFLTCRLDAHSAALLAKYTIEFVAIANINQVLSSTPSFSVGATVTTESNSGSTPSTTTSGTRTTTGAISSTHAGITTSPRHHVRLFTLKLYDNLTQACQYCELATGSY